MITLSKTTTTLVAVSLGACSTRTSRLPEAEGTLALTETVRVYSEVRQRCADVKVDVPSNAQLVELKDYDR